MAPLSCQRVLSLVATAVTLFSQPLYAQTFQRLGTCPTLGCIIPPDQSDFLAGQYFDIRLEVHAPQNGSEGVPGKVPDPNFTFTIEKVDSSGGAKPAAQFLNVQEPELESWSFTWYEDLFAKDAKTPSLVNVTSKAYRRIQLTEPGEYIATLTYDGGNTTTASWLVRSLDEVRKVKNVVFFIGDGMSTNMITAARLIGHQSVNGRYQSRLSLDKFPVMGHQMTHSIDSFITDSANSATSLYSGHKSTVNCLGVYADSSPDPFDDPKFESMFEIFYRLYRGSIGVVSTAFIADATPAATIAHTRSRGEYGAVIDSYLNGINNYSWPTNNFEGVDVIFGGGAENFYPPSKGGKTYQDKDYYAEFKNRGYQVVMNNTELSAARNDQKTLGIFSVSNMAKWLDRNIYTDNLKNQTNAPDGSKGDATDQPGLKEMTLKAIDILQARSTGKGWFLMSEAASIDKMFHQLDYDRALGELLELDDTVGATVRKLKKMGILKDTLVIVSADHGHGYDVMGSVDTKYLDAQESNRDKRRAVGVYQESGLSQYTINPGKTGALTHVDEGFPSDWDPRYTLFSGFGATPDHIEDFRVRKEGPREMAVNLGTKGSPNYYASFKDSHTGFVVNGTLPVGESQGVHSLTDVPVFALGPPKCQELFGGVYNNIDIFYNIADCLGLSRSTPPGGRWGAHGTGKSRPPTVRRGRGVRKGDREDDEDFAWW